MSTDRELLRKKIESLQDDGSEGYPFSQEELDILVAALAAPEHAAPPETERTGNHWWCPKCQREVDWREGSNEISLGMAAGQGLHILCKTKLELREGSSTLLKPPSVSPQAPTGDNRVVYQCPRCATSMEVDPTAKPSPRQGGTAEGADWVRVLSELEAKATPGPWRVYNLHRVSAGGITSPLMSYLYGPLDDDKRCVSLGSENKADHELVAALRNAWPQIKAALSATPRPDTGEGLVKPLPFEPTNDQLGGMMMAWLEAMFPDEHDYSATQEQLAAMRSAYKAAWRAAALEATRTGAESTGSLLWACQLAYRKHVMDDDSIGWGELGDYLLDAICNALGDDGSEKWKASVKAARALGREEKK